MLEDGDRALLDRVTILVVTYESRHCLEGLSPLLSVCPHVVLVDNASRDGTAQQAQALWSHARIEVMPYNQGFGAANNAGLRQISTPLALLLNPDCRLGLPALLTLIRASQAFPQAAILAPQLTDSHGRKDQSYRWPRWTWRSRGPIAQGPACVGFVCGAAMLWRLEAFAGVGYFDEDFFLYYEDDDLCLRLFQSRRPMMIIPEATSVHEGRQSVSGRFRMKSEHLRGYWHARSKLTFLQKHRSMQAARKARSRLLLLTTLALPLRVLFFSPRLIARMVGRWQGLATWTPEEMSHG
ncbi:MAG: N-acetylglucosaminyl-diphospho-decaprenol L-rhamnosyltransferase [Pseudomonadota bacterium]